MLSQPPRPRSRHRRSPMAPILPAVPRPFAGGARPVARPGRSSSLVGSLLFHLLLGATAVGLGWGLAPPYSPTTSEIIEVAVVEVPETPALPPAPAEDARSEAVAAPAPQAPAAEAPVAPPAPRVVPAPPRQAKPRPAAAQPRRVAPPQDARPQVTPADRGDLQAKLEAREAASRQRQAALAAAAAAAAAQEGAAAAPLTASPGPAQAVPAPQGRPDTSAGGLDGDLAGRGLLRRIDPSYPASMEAAQDEGAVRCRLYVSPDGRVQQVAVVGPSGRSAFDAAATRALQRWRFTPLEDPNAPLQQGEVTVTFRLVH